MLRALIWKEWRQQRAIVAVAAGLALLLPLLVYALGRTSSNRMYMLDLAELVPVLTTALVWPLFAAVIAATASCGETEGGSLVFLLSRPVSRSTIWAVKLGAAAAAFGAVVVFSFVVAELLHMWIVGQWYAFPFQNGPTTELGGEAMRALILGVIVVCFAATMFAGLLTRQQVTAAAAGVTATVAVAGAALLLQSVYSADANVGSPDFLWVFFLTITVAMLAGSFRAFTKGGLLAGTELRRTMWIVVPTIFLATVLGTALSAATAARIDISTAFLDEQMVVPGARQVIVGARGGTFSGQRYFVVGLDAEPRPLTKRMATGGVVSPDGRWLVYSSRLGALGMRRVDCELRAVRIDGSQDQLVADFAPCTGPRRFAHDGSRLAVRLGLDALMVVDLNARDEPHILPFRAPPAPGRGTAARLSGIVRWTDDDTELLVVSGTSVLLVDLAGGEAREVYADEVDAEYVSRRIAVTVATDTHLVVRRVVRRRNERGRMSSSTYDVIVDLRSGATEAFFDDCPEARSAILAADGSTIIHSGCAGPSDESGPELWARDLESGDERLFARLDVGALLMRPSPRGGRIFVHGQGRNYRVVENGGTFRPVDNFVVSGGLGPATGWSFEAWIGERAALLWDRTGRSPDRRIRLAYYDLDAGEGQLLLESRCGGC